MFCIFLHSLPLRFLSENVDFVVEIKPIKLFLFPLSSVFNKKFK